MLKDAQEKIHLAMMSYKNVTSGVHRFGGTEYKLGEKEIGHVHACVTEHRTSACRHGNYLVDIPFPMKIRDEIIKRGEADKHHVYPESGWVSVYLNNENDVDRAITLLKKSYKIVLERLKKRNQIKQI